MIRDGINGVPQPSRQFYRSYVLEEGWEQRGGPVVEGRLGPGARTHALPSQGRCIKARIVVPRALAPPDG